MIWDFILWLALAYLIASIVLRFLMKRRRSAEEISATRHWTSRLFGRGWKAPLVALVIAVGVFFLKAGPDLFGINWSDSEQAELEHFIEAIALYGQAGEISGSTQLREEGWESVNALLQAALSEADQVSDDVLLRLDPELKAVFHDKFKTGLRVGTHGLRYYTASPQKGKDTVEHYRMDSINQGRGLLQEWNEWFAAHRADIMDKLE